MIVESEIQYTVGLDAIPNDLEDYLAIDLSDIPADQKRHAKASRTILAYKNGEIDGSKLKQFADRVEHLISRKV